MKKNSYRIWGLAVLLIFVFVTLCGTVYGDSSTSGSGAKTQINQSISAKEAFDLIQKNRDNPNFVLLDVRTPEEFGAENIQGAVNIDYYASSYVKRLKRLDKKKTYLLYCRSGNRSGRSLKLMKKLGFMEVYHMSGGMIGWKAAGLSNNP
jgi:rhodanese-related sulfurtransferase